MRQILVGDTVQFFTADPELQRGNRLAGKAPAVRETVAGRTPQTPG